MADWDVVSVTPAQDDPWRVVKTGAAGQQQEPAPSSFGFADLATSIATGGATAPGKDTAVGQAMSNAPQSAVKVGKDIAHMVTDPVGTATSIKDLGFGVLEKLGKIGGNPVLPGHILPGGEHEKYAEAAGQYLMEEYGSEEAIRNKLAKDPVGMAMDVSTVLRGGAGLPGKVGRAIDATGRAVDPLVGVGKVLKGAGYVGSEILGGIGSHTGGKPLQIAAQAGAAGGEPAQAFLQNLRGQVPSEEALAAARKGLAAMVDQRGAAYRTEMAKMAAKDKAMAGGGIDTTLNFDKIDDALIKTANIKTFKGQDLSPSTAAIRQEMTQAIQDWRALPPKEFHTAEGLDALKQKLGDMREATEAGTPARVAANEIYHAVRQTIIDWDPQYAKVMKAYEEASKRIKEMEKSLSLNPNASIDTSLRKLQSVLRDNVATSYGHRRELAEFLVKAGAPNLIERLAGQALQPWLPRGLGRLAQNLGMEIGVLTGGFAKAAGLLAVGSPRLLGEASYYTGKASPYGVPAASAAYQSGRIGQNLNPREMVRQDAKAALRDKPEERFTKAQIESIRDVARGSASIDTRVAVKKWLEDANRRIDSQAPGYGGPI